MNIAVKNGDLNENLSKEQKDAIANKTDQARRSARFLMEDGDFNNEERTDRLAKAIANGVPDHEIIKQEEMSNEVNDAIYETEREITEDQLSEGFRRTRQEIGGVPMETIAEISLTHFDQSESRDFIDKLVIRHGKTYGERLFA